MTSLLLYELFYKIRIFNSFFEKLSRFEGVDVFFGGFTESCAYLYPILLEEGFQFFLIIEEQILVKIFCWNSVSFDDVFHDDFSQAVYYGDKRAGKDKITIPEMLIEASEVPGLNCFNDFLTFGDFCCVDQDFRVL